MTFFTDGLQMQPEEEGIHEFPLSTSRYALESAASAFQESPLMSITRASEVNLTQPLWMRDPSYMRDQIRRGGVMSLEPPPPTIPLEEAKKRVKEAGLEHQITNLGSGPDVNEPALDIMMRHARERQHREAQLSRGPSGFFPGVAATGAGFLAGAIDPLNVAAFSIPVLGEERTAALLASAGTSVLARAGARAGIGAIQGAAGTIPLLPLEAIAHTQDGRDYGFADALTSIASNAGLGGLMHAGFGAGADVWRGFRGRPVYPFAPGEPYFREPGAAPPPPPARAVPPEGGAAPASPPPAAPHGRLAPGEFPTVDELLAHEEVTGPGARPRGSFSLADILNDRGVAEEIERPQINREHDVPYGSLAGEGRGTFIDRSIPHQATIDGVSFDPAVPMNLARHIEREAVERQVGMFRAEHGRDPNVREQERIIEFANRHYVEPAEKAWVTGKGIDWERYQEAKRGWHSGIDHESPAHPPQGAYVTPLPPRIRERIGGGGERARRVAEGHAAAAVANRWRNKVVDWLKSAKNGDAIHGNIEGERYVARVRYSEGLKAEVRDLVPDHEGALPVLSLRDGKPEGKIEATVNPEHGGREPDSAGTALDSIGKGLEEGTHRAVSAAAPAAAEHAADVSEAALRDTFRDEIAKLRAEEAGEPQPLWISRLTEAGFADDNDPNLDIFTHAYGRIDLGEIPMVDKEGNHVGHFEVHNVTPDSISITASRLDDGKAGKGLGIYNYQRVVDWALRTGRQFVSDSGINQDARRVYQSLKRRGYDVRENPNVEVGPHGGITSTDRAPVFRVVGKEAVAPPELAKAEIERTAAEVAKAAGHHAVSALDEAATGLWELFGRGKRSFSGIGWDEETYARAKPHFIKAVYHFREAGGNIHELMRRLVRALRQDYGFKIDDIERMEPYAIRFVQDVHSGAIDLKKAVNEEVIGKLRTSNERLRADAGSAPHEGINTREILDAAVGEHGLTEKEAEDAIEQGVRSGDILRYRSPSGRSDFVYFVPKEGLPQYGETSPRGSVSRESAPRLEGLRRAYEEVREHTGAKEVDLNDMNDVLGFDWEDTRDVKALDEAVASGEAIRRVQPELDQNGRLKTTVEFRETSEERERADVSTRIADALMNAGQSREYAENFAQAAAEYYIARAKAIPGLGSPSELLARSNIEVRRAEFNALPGVHIGEGVREHLQISGMRVEDGRITFDVSVPEEPSRQFFQRTASDYGTDYTRMLKDLGPQWGTAIVIDQDGNVVHNQVGKESIGGAAVRINQDGTLSPGIVAFHGTPHDFEKFDISKIGTGEGNAAFGHGLYFAEAPDVAAAYRNALAPLPNVGGPVETQASLYLRRAVDRQRAIDELEETARNWDRNPNAKNVADDYRKSAELLKGGWSPKQSGRLFTVHITADPEHFLDWDKPLSEQSEHVKDALTNAGWGDYLKTPFNGSQLAPSIREGAEQLHKAGIPGIKYLDQGSRGTGKGSRNYVLFSDKDIEITHKDGTPVAKPERDGIVESLTNKGDGERELFQRDRTRPRTGLAGRPGGAREGYETWKTDRNVIARGRSGRPVRTEPLSSDRGSQRILEQIESVADAERAYGEAYEAGDAEAAAARLAQWHAAIDARDRLIEENEPPLVLNPNAPVSGQSAIVRDWLKEIGDSGIRTGDAWKQLVELYEGDANEAAEGLWRLARIKVLGHQYTPEFQAQMREAESGTRSYFQSDRRQGPGDISAGPYGQTMQFQNDRLHWWNNWSSILTAPKTAPDRMVLRRNYVLEALTGYRGDIKLSPTRAQAIRAKHPDVLDETWKNLPALVANPRFVLPYGENGVRVVLNAATKKGEPILVGIRDDGEIATITPQHDTEDQTGLERIAGQVVSAAKRGESVYVKDGGDASIAAAIEPASQGGNGHNRQRRGPVSRGANLPYASRSPDRQSVWRPAKNVITFDDVVQRQGRVFYQREGSPVQTETPEFKRWFGDSQVVDKDGKPLVVYHGGAVAETEGRQGITAFNPAYRGRYTGAKSAESAFFFSSSPEVANSYNSRAMEFSPLGGPQNRLFSAERTLDLWDEGHNKAEPYFDADENGWTVRVTRYDDWSVPYTDTDGYIYASRDEAADAASELAQTETDKAALNVEVRRRELEEANRDVTLRAGPAIYPVYLSVKNPLVHDFKGGDYHDQSFSELIEEAREEGHDGVLLKNVRDAHPLGEKPDEVSDVWAVFEPTQIKSATGNRGTFDPNDARILFQDQNRVNFSDPNHPEHELWKNAVPAIKDTQTGEVIKGRRGDMHIDLVHENPDVVSYARGYWDKANKKFVHWSETELDTTDLMTRAQRAKHGWFEQPPRAPGGEPKGRVTFHERNGDIIKRAIDLFQNADASTPIHEWFGHVFTEDLLEHAEHPEAPDWLKQDARTLREALGAAEKGPLTTEQHEQAARWMEQYMREGRAPSRRLEAIFAKFREWMLAIYRHIRDLGIPIKDEVRQVFDRYFATMEEIADYARDRPPIPEETIEPPPARGEEGPTVNPATGTQDILPPVESQQVLQGAIGSLIEGRPVRAGEQIAATREPAPDPNIVETVKGDGVEVRIWQRPGEDTFGATLVESETGGFLTAARGMKTIEEARRQARILLGQETTAPAPAEPSPPPQRQPAPSGPRAKDPADRSLFEHLAANGGIQPTADLQAVLGRVGPFVPGWGPLLRPKGKPIDLVVRDGDVEAYLGKGATVRDLMAAISDEARGRKRYQMGNEPAPAFDEDASRAAHESEIMGMLEEAGIPREELGGDRIARVIEIMEREHVDNPEAAFEQAVMEEARRDEDAGNVPPVPPELHIPGWDDDGTSGAPSGEGGVLQPFEPAEGAGTGTVAPSRGEGAQPPPAFEPVVPAVSLKDHFRDYFLQIPEFLERHSAHLEEGNRFATIVQARKFAAEMGFGDDPKAIDEAIEQGAVAAARAIALGEGDVADKYRALVDVYERQPRLGVRTSTSMRDQAYSTPVPLAYVASRLARVEPLRKVYEPSAGNGALLMEVEPPQYAFANEINPARAQALKDQGFTVTEDDASTPLWSNRLRDVGGVDIVIANPPFGAVKEGTASKVFDLTDIQRGYSTREIDHAIVLRSLEAMKDDGRAVLLIGGVTKLTRSEEARSDAYAKSKAKREFFKVLFDRYKVQDMLTVAGELYERQGAGWPIDVIVIEGRGKSERKVPAVDVPRVIKSWDELGEILNAAQRSRDEGVSGGQPGATPVELPAGGEAGSVPADTETAGGGTVGGGGNAEAGPAADVRVGRVPGEPGDVAAGAERAPAEAGLEPGGVGGGAGGPHIEPPAERQSPGVAETGEAAKEAAAATQEAMEPPKVKPRIVRTETETGAQVAYNPQSSHSNLGTLVPVNMKKSVADALASAAERRGDVDKFVADELGYSPAELADAFAAEQVDALALALDNMKQGKGFIIGDQTGIGKGRVNAGIIRWANRNGLIPIFVTEKPNLYGDMYRDLTDIGFSDMLGRDPRFLMTNADADVPLSEDGKLRLKTPSAKAHNAMLGATPSDAKTFLKDYDAVFTTYDQMNPFGGQETPRREFLRRIAPQAIVIFDESHNAGGQGAAQAARTPNRAVFARDLVAKARGVFYSSATYAKRPDVMDLYAKTDMVLAVANPKDLGEAIAKGGVPMQQAVAAMLARAGQYIRRERSFAGVEYNTPVVPVDQTAYRGISRSLNAVNEFSKIVGRVAKDIDKELKAEAEAVGYDGAVGEAGAESTAFTAIMHNVINQVLLAMKAKPAAKMAIEALERGEKPVLTVAGTMETFYKDFAEQLGIKHGEPIPADFSDVLKKYLDRTRTLIIKKPFMKKGEKGERKYLSDAELGPAGVAAYKAAKRLIESLDLKDLPVSPIDAIKDELRAAGYRVGEITGRGTVVDYSGKQPILRPRPGAEVTIKGRRETISRFNGGPKDNSLPADKHYDAMVINQAGSTGLSLHASERVGDQRKRHMLIVQPEANIDTHMQLLGRVHRTGQVVLPRYSQLIADIPAEKRPAAVLAKKMASLNANTTAARGSAMTAKDVPDFMNVYGDMVAAAFIEENPDVNARLGDPFDFEGGKVDSIEGAMRRLTGRIPLLDPDDQVRLYDHLESEYNSLLEQMKAAGENALEAQTLDLRAQTIERREVVARKAAADSPFAAPVTMEKVLARRLGKPFRSDEVVNKVLESIGESPSATIENAARLLSDLADPTSALGKRAAAAHERQAEKAIESFEDYKRSIIDAIEKPERAEAQRAKMDMDKDRFEALHGKLAPGARVNLKTANGNLVGVVLKVGQKGKPKNPLALSTWKADIAIADATKRIELPLSRLFEEGRADPENMLAIELGHFSDWIESRQQTLDRFDRLQSDVREDRYIATGNLLAAYDWLNRKGRIVNYTDDQGHTRQGILLPRDFDFQKHADAKQTPLGDEKAVVQWLRNNPGKALSTDDGNLRITFSPRKGGLIEAAGAKGRGGKYYLDKDLTALLPLSATGKEQGFVKQGGQMVSEIREANLEAAIRRIQELGTRFIAHQELPEAERVSSAPPMPGQTMTPREAWEQLANEPLPHEEQAAIDASREADNAPEPDSVSAEPSARAKAAMDAAEETSQQYEATQAYMPEEDRAAFETAMQDYSREQQQKAEVIKQGMACLMGGGFGGAPPVEARGPGGGEVTPLRPTAAAPEAPAAPAGPALNQGSHAAWREAPVSPTEGPGMNQGGHAQWRESRGAQEGPPVDHGEHARWRDGGE